MGVKRHNSFKIKIIQLKKFDFKQTGELRQKNKISLNQGIGAVARKSKNQYTIQLNVDISFGQEKSEVFYIQSAIIGVIEVESNFEENSLNNMVAIMYSYLRPMVAQVTVMAKLPPLDLPPANFEDFKVKVEKVKPQVNKYADGEVK